MTNEIRTRKDESHPIKQFEFRRKNIIPSRTKQTTLHLPAGQVDGQACGFPGTSKEQQQFSFPNNKFKIQNSTPRSLPPALPPAPPPASARHGRVRCRRAPRSPVPAGLRRCRCPLRSRNQNKGRYTCLVQPLCVHFRNLRSSPCGDQLETTLGLAGGGAQTAWGERRSASPGDRQTRVLCGAGGGSGWYG